VHHPRVVRRIALTALTAAAATAALAGAASAADPPEQAFTAPAYPGNTIAVDGPKRIVASTVITASLRGHARWAPWDMAFGAPTPYALALYVQDAALRPTCEPSFAAQRRQSINLAGLAADAGRRGFVVDEELSVSTAAEGPADLDWSTPTPGFAIRPGVERVRLCAYQRYVIDDVASFQRTVAVEQPACRLRPRSVRRGRALTVSCNVAGRVELRLRRSGGGSRTVTARLPANDKADTTTAKLSTHKLRAGRWTVRFASGGVALGRDRVTVR
jgi:hypothetical protein